jgi:hypothetical protein
MGQSLNGYQDQEFSEEVEYGVSSKKGGARVFCLRKVRREALRQLLALGQYDEYYSSVLKYTQGNADFGGVRIRQGYPDALDKMGMNRRNY